MGFAARTSASRALPPSPSELRRRRGGMLKSRV